MTPVLFVVAHTLESKAKLLSSCRGSNKKCSLSAEKSAHFFCMHQIKIANRNFVLCAVCVKRGKPCSGMCYVNCI
jgi:hypothetical protein